MNYQAKTVYKDKKVAQEYDQKRFCGFKGWMVDKREKLLVYKAINRAKIKPSSKLLDAPCGTGRLSLFLTEEGFEVTGVDISSAMVELCKEKIQHSRMRKQTEFLVGDAESLPFANSSFEAAISLRLFGHLPCENRHNVLRELYRVSKSFVVVAYYHKNSLRALLRKKMCARKGIFWNSVSLKQVDSELKATNLRSIAKFFLFPYVCETVIVLAKKS